VIPCLVTSPGEVGLEVFGVGASVLVVIVVLHGFGLDRIVDRYKRTAQKLREQATPTAVATGVFAWSIFLMLVLHLVETFVWALVVHRAGLIPQFRDAVYFCANAYTTLGEGDPMLPLSWRELSPIMAISGLFTFGWTTSVMFNVVGDHHDLCEELRTKRPNARIAAHLKSKFRRARKQGETK
jgi:hypothetical protein